MTSSPIINSSLYKRIELFALFLFIPIAIWLLTKEKLSESAVLMLVVATLSGSFAFQSNKRWQKLLQFLNLLVPALAILVLVKTSSPTFVYWSFPYVLYLYFKLSLGQASLVNLFFVTLISFVMYFSVDHDVVVLLICSQIGLTGLVSLIAVEFERQMLAYNKLRYVDEVTGLANSQAALIQFEDFHAKLVKDNMQANIVVLELGELKKKQSQLGFEQTEKWLKSISDKLKKRLRKSDCLYRLSSEEFLVFLTNTTSAQADLLAQELAEIKGEESTLSSGVMYGIAHCSQVPSLDSYIAIAREQITNKKVN